MISCHCYMKRSRLQQLEHCDSVHRKQTASETCFSRRIAHAGLANTSSILAHSSSNQPRIFLDRDNNLFVCVCVFFLNNISCIIICYNTITKQHTVPFLCQQWLDKKKKNRASHRAIPTLHQTTFQAIIYDVCKDQEVTNYRLLNGQRIILNTLKSNDQKILWKVIWCEVGIR